jgi:hypothetical protein
MYSILTPSDVGLAANGATGWGYIGEISSQRLRPYTAGFGAASTCVVGVIMNVLVPYMTNKNEWNWGLKTGWFYAGFGAPFAIGMWFLIPETAGYVSFVSFLLFLRYNSMLIQVLDAPQPNWMSYSRGRSSRGDSIRPRPQRRDLPRRRGRRVSKRRIFSEMRGFAQCGISHCSASQYRVSCSIALVCPQPSLRRSSPVISSIDISGLGLFLRSNSGE